MSYVADHSGRSNAIFGSYKPAVQVGMQPPTACHLGRRNPNIHTFDGASHSSLHEPVRSAAWTFAPNDPFDFHQAGKSAECRQGVVCRRRLA